MAYTFHELKQKTVAQLREVAKSMESEHEEVKGYSQLNKEHLLEKICKVLNIDMHEHHEVVGVDKKSLKAQIRQLKQRRDQALSSVDKKELKAVRKEIKKLKNKLRTATV
jgi:hypothetical protein